MRSWPNATIGAVTKRVTKGTTPTTGGGSFSTSGVSFVKVESITAEGRVDITKLAYIDEDTHGRLQRSILEIDDVLFSIAGTIGRVARVPQDLLPANTNQAVAIVRADPALVDVGYLLYSLRDRPRVNQALSRVVQSVQANLSLSELSSIEISLPPMGQQRAIAELLGALDDKIAADDSVAKASLHLAESLFARAAEGVELAEYTFADLAEIGGGGTPKTGVEEYWNGDVPWATPTDVTALHGPYLDSTSRRISEAGLKASSSALYPTGSILMTSRATIGAFAIAQVPMAVNQGFIVVNAKDPGSHWWLFHEMNRRVNEFISHANGATFLELSRGKFKQFRVHAPTTEQARTFGAVVGPLHESAAHSLDESRLIAKTRDVLLPLLMSGKVRVKDAVKIVEGVV